MTWYLNDIIIILAYGLQHTLLTTKIAVKIYNAIFPAWSWNIVYSAISVVILVVGFRYWRSSDIYLYHFVPGSLAYHASTITLAASLFFFFYCFKYTTSFWQWLGVRQVVATIRNEKMPEYYRVRREGVKRYIRFPHHTCLIVLFWTHPVMNLDTLLLAIGATIYLYVGTYHQDLRGLALLGDDWAQYRKNTALLIPGPRILIRIFRDIFGSSPAVRKEQGSGNPITDANYEHN